MNEEPVKMLQTYETTVMSKDSEHAMHVVVVPNGSLPSNITVETTLQKLGIKKHGSTSPSNLARDLAVLLSPRLPEQNAFKILAETAGPPTAHSQPSREFQPSEEDVRFAEYASFERVIPVEQSLLSQESLAKIVRLSGVSIGAYVGFVSFGSSPPLLMISVPIGMIICGAAHAVGQALEEGLRDRILSWLKGKKGETTKGDRRKKQGGSEE
jgi:hypothetical protein